MLTIIVSILYLVAILTIFITNYISGYTQLLQQMSYENSFFETVGTLFLFSIFFYGVYSLIKYRFNRYERWGIALFSILALIAGMEEISWGQQIFHFPSSEYFFNHNLQHETNLHNLIDGNLFSSLLYSSIYIFLVFIPLFSKLFIPSSYFDINPHTILVILFGSAFQLYFNQDIGVIFDMVTYIIALGLFGFYLIRVERKNFWLKVHFFVVLFTATLSMLSYKIYDFYNMQYEIRESFIELAGFLIFVELVQKLRIERFKS